MNETLYVFYNKQTHQLTKPLTRGAAEICRRQMNVYRAATPEETQASIAKYLKGKTVNVAQPKPEPKAPVLAVPLAEEAPKIGPAVRMSRKKKDETQPEALTTPTTTENE